MTTQERLSALDASFLYLDGPTTPMHISSLAVYEGPAPSTSELRRHLIGRLPLVPRFRQRLEVVPFGAHRPVWVNDPEFDLSMHLHRVALPGPGGERELRGIAADILSKPLCRTRPLWEMWLLEGLAHGRFAILSKTHHCLWDGVSGIDLHSVLLDAGAQPDALPLDAAPPGVDPPPSRAQLWTKALRDHVTDGLGAAREIVRAVRDPRSAMQAAVEVATGSAALAGSLLRPAPASSLNGALCSGRRYELGRASLDDLRALKGTFGATVNDAVLAAVAGGLHKWQRSRGMLPRDLKVMVPVSVRAQRERGLPGNRVVMLIVPLPVGDDDPVRRLRTIGTTMSAAKASAQISAGRAFVSASGLLPPQAVAAISRAQAAYRSFNLLVTNVPGPQFPLYLRGRRLLELFPQAPLAKRQGLSVAALSYDGRIGFGLLGDHALLPDLEVLASGIEESVDELASLTRTTDLAPERALTMAAAR